MDFGSSSDVPDARLCKQRERGRHGSRRNRTCRRCKFARHFLPVIFASRARITGVD
jgi:hypothetical protein